MKLFLTILLTLETILHICGQNETSIILGLIKDLEIRSCFLVNEIGNNLNLFLAEKILFKGIPTAFISYEKLAEYMELKEEINDGIGIILKETDFNRVEEISQQLFTVGADDLFSHPIPF